MLLDMNGTGITDIEGLVERYCPIYVAVQRLDPHGFILKKMSLEGRAIRMCL